MSASATRAAGSAPSGAVPRRIRQKGIRRGSTWFMIVPALVIYLFAVIVPSVRGGVLAFTDWNGLFPDYKFVGFDNFAKIFTTPASLGALWHTFFLAVAVTIIQNLIGLLLALGVNSRIKSRNVLRVLLFAPAVVMPVVVAYLWQYLLAPKGAVNTFFAAIGMPWLKPDWLGDDTLALWSIVLTVVWQFAGYSMVIFLANLQGVPEEVLEASALDGAGAVKRFWYIVRPLLAPSITINLMLSIIGGLKMFDQVWVLTQGGPGGATETISTLLYRNAFQFGEFGYGIALALVLTLFVAIVAGVQYRVIRQRNDV
jgi:raffinose/stachyose/melibiose transport system permease protein